MARNASGQFAAIRSEGGLLPPDLLLKILGQDVDGTNPETYGLGSKGNLRDAMADAWQGARQHWISFQRIRNRLQPSDSGTTETRTWVQNLFRELGYRQLPYTAAETIDKRTFAISHRAGTATNAAPIHIISANQNGGLDGRGHRGTNAHALLQGYLNATPHKWGLVTNGLQFRLLRENRQIDRVQLLEFDLEQMLEQEMYSEFQLFWLVVHATRWVQPGEPQPTAWLEIWSQTAASEGTRMLGNLSQGVRIAIQELGQGLVEHRDNTWLREQLGSGVLSTQELYRELLRLVYRLLFLMVAEERNLLFPETATQQQRERYESNYSVTRLRNLAAKKRHAESHYHDLWINLLVTFDAMRFPKEAQAFGLKPLSGGLFGDASCKHVADEPAPGTQGEAPTDGRPRVSNQRLITAINALSGVERDGVTRRVNYRDLDVEELGSVYEGLLEQQPSISPTAHGGYHFSLDTSGERKSTGSYYTPSSLVQEVLNSALDPVIAHALESASTQETKERALLALNVCDPACGSGHFLLGAARRIGRELAQVRAGEGNEPGVHELQHATRDAIRHCIYGVDKNPLAVDLCRVALWIESHEPGAPISFLDHHIMRGDSLVGVFDLEVLEKGIPDDAYTAGTGDVKSVANSIKAQNRTERPKVLDSGETATQYGLFDDQQVRDLVESLGRRLNEIEQMPDDSVEAVTNKANAYEQLKRRDDWNDTTLACHLWTYAFFAPYTPETRELVPTSATVRKMLETGGRSVRGDLVGKATAVAAEIGFFHWKLQFPEVFARGGFDCMLGNPPWERVKLQEKEFFASRDTEIAQAANKAARNRLIKTLPERKPQLLAEYEAALREAEGASKFLRKSERFALTGRGDVNLYSVFAEHFRESIGAFGRAGIIVPTGIATDDTNRYFFADVVEKFSIASLFDFENRRKLFQDVDSRMKFSILVLAGSGRTDPTFRAGFFLYDPVDIHDPERTMELSASEIALMNPNTKTSPVFRSVRDAEITRAIYERVPVLVNESDSTNGNPWGVKFNRMFDMSNDSHLFRTKEQLELVAEVVEGNRWRRKLDLTISEEDAAGLNLPPRHETYWLPLYEAKLMHQFDHRFATYESDGTPRDVTPEEKADPRYAPMAQYWISEVEVDRRAKGSDGYGSGFVTFYRLISRATDIQSTIATLNSFAPSNNSIGVIQVSKPLSIRAIMLANLNTFAVDFVSRQKLGGINFSFFIFKQLPVVAPETYSEVMIEAISKRVLELTYTSWDMQPFAKDLGFDGPPFVWDDDRRAQLRAELDGIYAHLYGISRDDFDYILDTFPIVRSNDIKAYGEYRTKRLCLEAWDHFSPETLRALELQVREIESKLRSTISTALGGDPKLLASSMRAKLQEQYSIHNPGKDVASATLQTLLNSSYLTDLEKIIRHENVWNELKDTWQISKRQLEERVSHLHAFRNPMSHVRDVAEDVRTNGEAAVQWFEELLG